MRITQCILLLSLFVTFLYSCAENKEKKALELYDTNCSSCHLRPSIQSLPKALWKNRVLPEMSARMGMRDSAYSPYAGHSFKEQEAMMKSGIFALSPLLEREEWQLLKDYIIEQAPDSLMMPHKRIAHDYLEGFIPRPTTFDTLSGLMFTFLNFDAHTQRIELGDISGRILTYDFRQKKLAIMNNFPRPITWFSKSRNAAYVTTVGNLNPSETASGRIFMEKEGVFTEIPEILHRPVHTAVEDLNGDGKDELLVSEFGYLTGKLTLLKQNDAMEFEKQLLLGLPGVIRTVVKDIDGDGKKDIVALFSQGDENISIFYQMDGLKFRLDKVIRFSPIYGSSWFELIDFDNDGDDDIVTVHGDNADKTYIPKPYHGLRLHINDGNNQFEEKYFYPMNGATRVVAKDFDQDGDVDFGLLSTFPDYENPKESPFVYLENKNAADFTFEDSSLEESNYARWLLMDTGDVDGDGDEDIILSSFSYAFTPVPEEKTNFWREKGIDLLILENKTR